MERGQTNPADADQEPLDCRRIDYNSHNRRTEHALKNLVNAGQEPLRCQNDGCMLRSRRHEQMHFVYAAAEPRRCQKFDRREHNSSSYCQEFHIIINLQNKQRVIIMEDHDKLEVMSQKFDWNKS